jgi:hypothetical protein
MSIAAPVVVRIYKQSIQRVPCELNQLNSFAVFIFIGASSQKIFQWIGSRSMSDDRSLAELFSVKVNNDDFQGCATIDTLIEFSEKEDVLSEILDIMWVKNEGIHLLLD